MNYRIIESERIVRIEEALWNLIYIFILLSTVHILHTCIEFSLANPFCFLHSLSHYTANLFFHCWVQIACFLQLHFWLKTFIFPFSHHVKYHFTLHIKMRWTIQIFHALCTHFLLYITKPGLHDTHTIAIAQFWIYLLVFDIFFVYSFSTQHIKAYVNCLVHFPSFNSKFMFFLEIQTVGLVNVNEKYVGYFYSDFLQIHVFKACLDT